MAQKNKDSNMQEMYGELQNSYTKLNKQIADIYTDLSDKYKVPRKTIHKLHELNGLLMRFKILSNMYNLQRDIEEAE